MTKEVHWYDKYLLGKLTSGHGESHCISLNIITGRSCPLLCTNNQTKINLSFFFFNIGGLCQDYIYSGMVTSANEHCLVKQMMA